MAYIGNVPAEKYTALTQQTFSTPTGTSFTLSQAVTNSVDIDLYIDNVKQDPTTYSVSGTALTTSTIASPSTMYCIYNGRAMQTVNPPDDSVGLSQMASATDGNLITFDASGNPAYVATGSDSQVLTSAGAGQPCAFETLTTGKVLQVVNVQTGIKASGTALIPLDNTIPQISEGTEYMTLAITPISASSKLRIDVHLLGSASLAGQVFTGALFRDSTASALASTIVFEEATAYVQPIAITHHVSSGSTSTTTFRVRASQNQSGTFYFNANADYYGGTLASTITITEYSV